MPFARWRLTIAPLGECHESPNGGYNAYLQWREGGVSPQVVFEILSPGNRGAELDRKSSFYETYEVEEYYIHDPDDNTLEG
jgi:Uma2 family endonuclease